MSANLTLVVCSLFVLGLTVLFAHLRSPRLDVVDMYVLMVGIFFGAYTLIDALAKDLLGIDPVLSALVVLLVALTVGLAWFISRLLPIGFQRALQVRYLAAQWARVNSWITLLVLSSVLVIGIYGYRQFGIISYISQADLERSGTTLPYWFTSIWTLIPTLLLCVFLAGISKVLVSEGKMRLFWIVVLAVVVLLAAFYGRRSIFYLMFIFFVLWFPVRGRNLVSLRSVALSMVMLSMLFVYSNAFQTYRPALSIDPTATSGISGVHSFWETSVNAEPTLSNLEGRWALWQYNYSILYKQESSSRVEIPYGDITWQGIKNAVPRVFWAEKEVYNLDEMTAHLYGLLVTDYPTNNFAMVQADFGYLSVILLPVQLLFVFASMAVLVRATRRRPTLLLFVTGIFLSYLLSIEADYADFFILYRNVAVAVVVCVIGYAAVKLIPPIALKTRQRVR